MPRDADTHTRAWMNWEGETLVLALRIQPRASRAAVCGVHAGRLKLAVTGPPVDDAANREVIAMLAKAFKVSKSRVRIIAGTRSRAKRVEVIAPGRLPDWLDAPR